MWRLSCRVRCGVGERVPPAALTDRTASPLGRLSVRVRTGAYRLQRPCIMTQQQQPAIEEVRTTLTLQGRVRFLYSSHTAVAAAALCSSIAKTSDADSD